MKKVRLLPILLALTLLSGCALPEAFRMKGINADALFTDPQATATAEPEPSSTPRPEGAQGRVLELLEALLADDRDAVRSICPGLPGYLDGERIESESLRSLYRCAYGNLSLRILNFTEWENSATVGAEITAPDMRALLETLSGELSSLPQGADVPAEADARLPALLEQAVESSVTRRVSISLRKQAGDWVVSNAADLINALSGSLTQALAEFDLPGGDGEDVVLPDADSHSRSCLLGYDFCSATVTAIYPNDPEGYVLEAEFCNLSDTTLVFSLRDVQINGCLLDPEWSCEVGPGATVVSRICWDRSALAAMGVESVGSLTFVVDVFDKPAWPVYPRLSQYAALCPNGVGVSNAAPQGGAGQALLYDAYARFAVLDIENDDCWGYTLTIEIENRTQETLWYSLGDVTVNGRDYDPGWSQTLPAGSRAVETIRFEAGQLMLRDVSRVEQLDFRLYVSSLNNLDYRDASISTGGHYLLGGELTA